MCKCECGCFLCCPKDDLVEDLRNFNLSEKVLTSICSARLFAQNLAESLDPEHISGWSTLVGIIEAKLALAKQEMKIERKLEQL
jgi:hypothetical protein